MERTELIRKLVLTLHLSVPERQALGAPEVSWAEVAKIVKEVFEREGRFPPNRKRWHPGELVYEGRILEATGEGTFEITRQRSHATNPYSLAEESTSVFNDRDSAVQSFILEEWPNGIDGFRIRWLAESFHVGRCRLLLHLNNGFTKVQISGGSTMDIPTESIPAKYRTIGSKFDLTIVQSSGDEGDHYIFEADTE